MLGRSKTVGYKLCDCRQCKYGTSNKSAKRYAKRAARNIERLTWRKEA